MVPKLDGLFDRCLCNIISHDSKLAVILRERCVCEKGHILLYKVVLMYTMNLTAVSNLQIQYFTCSSYRERKHVLLCFIISDWKMSTTMATILSKQMFYYIVTSGLVAFCTAPYGVCPFLTGLVPALILTVGGHDTQVYKVKM